MLIFAEVVRDEPIRRVAVAGLVAGALVLMPALTEAASKGAKPVQTSSPTAAEVAAPSAGSAETRISPYTIANRQHAGGPRAGTSPTKALSVRGPHQAPGPGQRH